MRHDCGATLIPQTPLLETLRAEIERADGFLPFERFMALCLYAPRLGYYTKERSQNEAAIFGAGLSSAADFVTAPLLTPLFARALSRQVAQWLHWGGWQNAARIAEFGPGSGALAAELITALQSSGVRVQEYHLIEISQPLQRQQAAALAPLRQQWPHLQCHWPEALPPDFCGIVIANEWLDAFPCHWLECKAGVWHERGVAWSDGALALMARPTTLRPPLTEALPPEYLTETTPLAEQAVEQMARSIQAGAVLLIDYGLPEREFYLPQRVMGTLMAHTRQRSHADPLSHPGEQDLSAHVNFSAIARAAQRGGMQLAGFTTQAHLLMNLGILDDLLQSAEPGTPAYLRAANSLQRLLTEHEMGEAFKAIAFTKNLPAAESVASLGFGKSDRSAAL